MPFVALRAIMVGVVVGVSPGLFFAEDVSYVGMYVVPILLI